MASNVMQNQQNCFSGQTDACDFFPALGSNFHSNGEYGSRVVNEHRVSEDQGHVLPPMSSFSQSFPSPGDYRPNYHSFDQTADQESASIDFNHILTMGCEAVADKSQPEPAATATSASASANEPQTDFRSSSGIQSYSSVLYHNFSGDAFMSNNNSEVNLDSANVYLNSVDSQMVTSGTNSYYAPLDPNHSGDTSYQQHQQSFVSHQCISGPSDYTTSHSVVPDASSHMQHHQTVVEQHNSSQHPDQPLPAAGYPFQSFSSRLPPDQQQASGQNSTMSRAAFSHPFTSNDFFSFGMEDAENSESLIDLQSTLDLLPPTPQPLTAQPIRSKEQSVNHHKDFETHSHNFASSGAFSFLDDQLASSSPTVQQLQPQAVPRAEHQTQESESADSLIQQVQCFKCRLCDFLSLERSAVMGHITEKHSQRQQSLVAEESAATFRVNESDGNKILSCSSRCKSFSSLENHTNQLASDHQIIAPAPLVTASSQQQTLELESTSKTTTNTTSQNTTKTRSSNVESCNDPVATVTPSAADPSNPSNSVFCPETSVLVPSSSSPALIQSSEAAVSSVAVSPERLQLTLADKSIENNSSSVGSNKMPAPKVMSNKKLAWQAKIVREQGSYICSKKKCSVRFTSLEKMELHEKCHQDDGNGFACCECDLFKSDHWNSCSGHLWRKHSIDMDLYRCELCSYRSYSLSILENIHKKIHSSEKNYVCHICQKAFKNQKQLVNHKARHDKRPASQPAAADKTQTTASAGEKVRKTGKSSTHVCELCSKAFPEMRPLRIHMDMVHRKKRPYLCLQCGHSAASKGALRVHIRSHTGEKPFKCEECEYSTSDHNSLRRHKMRHSGERPYKCPFCSYACIQSSTYKQHLRNKHPNESEGVMFTCSSCGFKTVNEEIFRTHKTEHQNKVSGVRFRAAARPLRHSRSDGESSSSSCSSSSPPPSSTSPDSPMMQLVKGIVGSSSDLQTPSSIACLPNELTGTTSDSSPLAITNC